MLENINKIQIGYSIGFYQNKKYGITKSVFNNGKSFKIYAEELQGNDYISLNYYITSSKELLKPCEMSKQKVIQFLKKCNLIEIEKNG